MQDGRELVSVVLESGLGHSVAIWVFRMSSEAGILMTSFYLFIYFCILEGRVVVQRKKKKGSLWYKLVKALSHV